VRARGCIALAATLLAPGCRQAGDSAAIRDHLRARDAAAVVREAAAVRYAPPADGRLKDGQVRMYLLVRERECRIREAAAVEAQRRRAAGAVAERPERPERSARYREPLARLRALEERALAAAAGFEAPAAGSGVAAARESGG